MQQNQIEVLGEVEVEQGASGVHFHVSLEGSSFYTGRAALTQAKELASLVEALRTEGIDPGAIDLVSVRSSVQSGVFSRSSTALYELRIRLAGLDRVAHVLGVLATSKQATLERLEYQYASDADEEARLLAEASRQGRVKALAIAAALGQELQGLALAQEVRPSVRGEPSPLAAGVASPARMRAPAELGMEVRHHRKLRREVRLVFTVVAQAARV